MTPDIHDTPPSEEKPSSEWSDKAFDSLWLAVEPLFDEEPESVLGNTEEEEETSIYED